MKISGRTAIGLMSLLRCRELPQIYLIASDSNLGSPRAFVAIYTFKPGPIAFRPPTIAHVLLMGACPQIASAIVNGVPIDVVYQLVRISAKNQTMHTLLADARNKPNYIPAIVDVPRKPAYLLEVIGIDLRISVVREQKHGIPGNKKSRADGIRTRFRNIGWHKRKSPLSGGLRFLQTQWYGQILPEIFRVYKIQEEIISFGGFFAELAPTAPAEPTSAQALEGVASSEAPAPR